MLSNYINKLLDLKDVKVKEITQADHFIEIHIETKPTLHTCPACGNETKRIHDYRMQKIKDLPFQ